MKKQLTIILIGLTFFGCSSSGEKGISSKEYHFITSDSIKVDFLTPMKLRDYSPANETYLLSTEWNGEIIEINKKGEVSSHFELSEDGPNAISNQTGIGYLKDEITLYAMERGFVQFDRKGQIIQEFSIPYSHSYLFFLPYLHIFPSENGFTYLKPLQSADFKDGMGEKFYQHYYDMPLLERLDTLADQTEPAMKFPKTSSYSDGENHGIYIPIIRKKGPSWYVSLWLENQFYVYKEENNDLVLDTTVTVPIKDLIQYKSVAMSESEHFFDINKGIQPGHISDILLTENKIVVIYRKGLSAFQTQSVTSDGKEITLEKMDPFYAAIYDSELNLLDPEVPFPAGIEYPSVVNDRGEIAVMKKPSHFETEEDQLTIYQLKLASE